MSALLIALIVFAVVFAGAMSGQWLSLHLPERHRSPETHDAIKLTTGMISVLAALVLGLLTASVKNSFDATDSQIRQFASTLILLNETLKDFGAEETAAARDQLRRYAARALEDNWPQESPGPVKMPVRMEDVESGKLLDGVRIAVVALPAGDARQSGLRSQARALAEGALQTRWLLIERGGTSIQPLLLEVLIAWITLIFISFGYNAPPNATVRTALFLGAAALAACVFLIDEMDSPFEGLITVSSAPMRDALAHMSQ
jgi:hypothetical protein